MSNKKTKFKTDITHLANFKTTMVDFYDKWSPPFSELEKKIGEIPLCLVMKYMDYNEWEDTRYCFGFQCPERIFKRSHKYYCNDCFYKLQKDGFNMCKKCGLIEEECYHCNYCHKIACVCRYCKMCGSHERECDCEYDFSDYFY